MHSTYESDFIPPHHIEAEQAVLGSMLIERRAVDTALELLKAGEFYRDAHRTLFEAMADMADHGIAIDLTTLAAELTRLGRFDEVGGYMYLTCLMDAPSTAANIEYYAGIVKDKALLRGLLQASIDIQGLAFSHEVDAAEALDAAQAAVFALGDTRATAAFTHIRPIVDSELDKLEIRYHNQNAVNGLETPFQDLNYLTGGLQNGDMIVIGARPSLGKTALAMAIARHAAQHQPGCTAVFSLEMNKESLTQRLLCSEASIDSVRFRGGWMQAEEWQRVGEACTRLAELRLWIDDATNPSLLDMRARCRRLAREMPLSLVIIDYLQLMRFHKRTENRVQEISEIARGIKSLARELNVPVIALSQVNRQCETRTNKRPMLSDLKDGGSIEQEADLVIFLYRDSYYKDSDPTDECEEAELIVAKQRNGATGTAKTGWMRRYARFADMETKRNDDD